MAKAAAWTMLATSSIQYRMTSVTTAMPMADAETNNIAVPTISTVRFGNRSAATPPNGVATSIEIPKARNTPPSPALVPVRSRASHPRATAWAMTPKTTAAELYSSRR